jgi:pyruvate formate lyase activating enzyme
MLTGQIHSTESMGTLDGPGLRTVVFMQGCPLKCKFCHNVDCTLFQGGKTYRVSQLKKKLLQDKAYWKTYNPGDAQESIKGGVTLSGGDPIIQPRFAAELLKALKQEKVHTAFDTCLHTSEKTLDMLFPFVDLWMVSIKHMDPIKAKDLAGVTNELTLRNLHYLDNKITQTQSHARIRNRFVVIPGMTDNQELIMELGQFVSTIKNLEVLELLAYGSHGAFKWEELYGFYALENVRDATRADLEKVAKWLEPYKIPLKY